MATVDEDSIGAVAARLSDDAKAFARAEIDLQKARAFAVVRSYTRVAILGVVAIATLHLALTALTVALVVAVAQSLGGWWAVLIVPGGFLLVAIVAGLLAKAALPGKSS